MGGADWFHTKARRCEEKVGPRIESGVTLKGVARDTLRWLALFAIVGIVGGSFWMWFAGADGCAEVLGGFKLGWC